MLSRYPISYQVTSMPENCMVEDCKSVGEREQMQDEREENIEAGHPCHIEDKPPSSP
jgi:hypothetical protein